MNGDRALKAGFPLLLLFSMPVLAQDLKHRPAPPKDVDAIERPYLEGGEFIRPGMVWTPYKKKGEGTIWKQAEINSCVRCMKPMTWKKAAFDKKALSMWMVAVAMAVADTESTVRQPCLKAGTCREFSPILGTTRGRQYGIRLPAIALAWGCSAWLRKGNQRLHIGGDRLWIILPIVYIASPAGAAISNISRHPK